MATSLQSKPDSNAPGSARLLRAVTVYLDRKGIDSEEAIGDDPFLNEQPLGILRQAIRAIRARNGGFLSSLLDRRLGLTESAVPALPQGTGDDLWVPAEEARYKVDRTCWITHGISIMLGNDLDMFLAQWHAKSFTPTAGYAVYALQSALTQDIHWYCAMPLTNRRILVRELVCPTLLKKAWKSVRYASSFPVETAKAIFDTLITTSTPTNKLGTVGKEVAAIELPLHTALLTFATNGAINVPNAHTIVTSA